MRYDIEMTDKPKSTVKLCSLQDDTPCYGKGALIPPHFNKSKAIKLAKSTKKNSDQFTPVFAKKEAVKKRHKKTARALAAVAVLTLLVFANATVPGLIDKYEQSANSQLSLNDLNQKSSVPLDYSALPTFKKSNSIIETRDLFLEERRSFIEVDITQGQLRYFKKGVLLQSAEILDVGERGSWWETPPGLYVVEEKEEQVFSNLAQANFPWQITFESNFIIHGWPTYPNGGDVMSEFRGGGIRLSNQSAEILYKNIRTGTPILVHKQAVEVPDVFVYEPKVPTLGTLHYFVADLENGTVLAASDLDEPAPIASLTKLMTAVVAAEKLNLDGRIQVSSSTFVTSLIPRLSSGSSVSVYSLLQLLLVESSNEAADTLASEFGRDNFIAAMNAKAEQLGMSNTNFADPSGLSSENVSTVGDLHILASYIYHNRPFIFEITAREEVPTAYVGGEFSGLVNFNEVKGMENFIGGKVGETIAAKQTSITLHSLKFDGQERTVLVILLGSEDRSGDVTKLISYVKDRFQ